MIQSEHVRERFSRRLAQACKNAGLDSRGRGKEIASAVGVTSKAVSKWFNAESMPRPETMAALASFLNVDVAWLQLGYDEEIISDSSATPHSDFANRLISLMDQNGVNVNELRDIAGVSYEMARRYMQGTMKPRPDKIKKIASALGATLSYLDYGEGENKGPSDVERITQLKTKYPEYINTPELIRTIEIPKAKVYELFGKDSLSGIYILNADNDAMSPTIEKKDLLFIDSTIASFDGNGIYVFSLEGTLCINRLQKMPGHKLAVIPDNNKYTTYEIDENGTPEFFILGKLIKHLPFSFNDYS